MIRRTPVPLWFALLFAVATACDRRPATRATDTSAAGRKTVARADSVDLYRLTNAGVGAVSVEAAAAELRHRATLLRDTVELGDEAIPESVAVLLVGGETVRAVRGDSGRLYRLEVYSPRFRTADSLGPGTSLARLLREPGVHAFIGEGAVYVETPRYCGLRFRLADSGELAIGPDSVGPAELRRLPPATTVSEVLVVGCDRS